MCLYFKSSWTSSDHSSGLLVGGWVHPAHIHDFWEPIWQCWEKEKVLKTRKYMYLDQQKAHPLTGLIYPSGLAVIPWEAEESSRTKRQAVTILNSICPKAAAVAFSWQHLEYKPSCKVATLLISQSAGTTVTDTFCEEVMSWEISHSSHC